MTDQPHTVNLLYTFYPQAAEGAASSSEIAKLSSDEEAIDKAKEVLARHPGATSVLVWQKGRLVCLLWAEGHKPQPTPAVSVAGPTTEAAIRVDKRLPIQTDGPKKRSRPQRAAGRA